MLVLSRKSGQSIVISGRIKLTVNRIAGNRVVLAFDAPQHIRIHRSELCVLADEGRDESNRSPKSSVSIDETGAAHK